MKRLLFTLLILICSSSVCFALLTIDGYEYESVEIMEWNGTDEPSLSASGKATTYFDNTDNTLYKSINGGAWEEWTGSTGAGTQTNDGGFVSGDLSVSGDVSANGDMTANSYFGDGSNLTGVASSLTNIVDSVDGVVISGDVSASGNVSSDTLNVRIINLDGTGTLNLLDAIDSTTETTLETYLDHDDLNGYVAGEHIPWGNTTSSLSISGNSTFWNDLTVDGTLSANIFQAPAGGTGDLQIAGSVSISDDLSVNGDSFLKVNNISKSGSFSIGGSDAYGGVFYVDGQATITLAPVVDGMNFSIITIGAAGIQVAPNSSDYFILDGTVLDDGDRANNLTTAGDIAVFTYFSADGFVVSSNTWTDGS